MVPLEQIFYFYFYFLPLEQFCTFLLDCSSKHGLSIKHLEILNLYLFICTVKKEDLLSSGCCFSRLFEVMPESLNMLLSDAML